MIYRILTREEMDQVPKVPDPKDMVTVIGAIDDDGRVAAAMGVFVAVHIDPIWIRKDKRNNPRLGLRLWGKTKEHLASMGAGGVLALIFDGDPGPPTEDLVARICKFAGGYEVSGRMFLIPL